MKVALLIVFILSNSLVAQRSDHNTKKGYIAEGYDIVAYFDNEAIEGDKQFSTDYNGTKYKFKSKENLEKFLSNPSQYMPQYGGFCAYAIADKGKKVGIDPKTFLIKDGKLYLFYNAWGTNTLELWNQNDTKILTQKADKNWKAIMKEE